FPALHPFFFPDGFAKKFLTPVAARLTLTPAKQRKLRQARGLCGPEPCRRFSTDPARIWAGPPPRVPRGTLSRASPLRGCFPFPPVDHARHPVRPLPGRQTPRLLAAGRPRPPLSASPGRSLFPPRDTRPGVAGGGPYGRSHDPLRRTARSTSP